MQAFSEFWYVYLIITVLAFGYAFFNQVRRMKRMMNRDVFVQGLQDAFEQGLLAFVVSGFVGSVSFILFLIAIFWQLVKGVNV